MATSKSNREKIELAILTQRGIVQDWKESDGSNRGRYMAEGILIGLEHAAQIMGIEVL